MARQTNAVEGGQWLYNERNPPSLHVCATPAIAPTRHHHTNHHLAVVILAHLDSKETERKGCSERGGGLKTRAPKTCRQLYPELKKWQS